MHRINERFPRQPHHVAFTHNLLLREEDEGLEHSCLVMFPRPQFTLVFFLISPSFPPNLPRTVSQVRERRISPVVCSNTEERRMRRKRGRGGKQRQHRPQ